MRKFCYVMLLAVVAFSGCQNEEFKKGKQGVEYKIISNGSNKKINVGDFMQLHVGQYYATGKKDSLLSDTRTGSGPMIEILDSATTPPAYFEVLKQLKDQDSLVLRILTDSAFSKAPGQMPGWLKKGHYLTTTVKIINVFTDRKAADSARIAEMHKTQVRDSIKGLELLAQDDKTLQEYFSKNNIHPVKSPEGTYVEILQPGTGNNIDTSVIVLVNYTGRTLDGNVFDSNTDSSLVHHPVEPRLNVNMTGERGLGLTVIKGWTAGLKLLNKGAKAKFYIPSTLAYGPRGSGEKIPPNSILIFDIEVMDILSKDQARAIQKEKMDMNKARQKAYADSISKIKARADTSHKK
jgi:FKBP-type peptidyl-prolyl cis-trans isomerase FkpA